MEKILNKQHLENLESLQINNDVKDGLREFLNKYDMFSESDESQDNFIKTINPQENLIKTIESSKDFNECLYNLLLLLDHYTGDEEDIRTYLKKYDNLLRVIQILNHLYRSIEKLPSNDEINKIYKDALDQFNLLNN